MPQGQDLAWWIVIFFCLGFMCWWPWYQAMKREREGLANPEECPRCGRLTETLDLHVRYCKGQAVRRNPLGGNRSIIQRAMKRGEVKDVVGKKKDDLEDLFPKE